MMRGGYIATAEERINDGYGRMSDFPGSGYAAGAPVSLYNKNKVIMEQEHMWEQK